MTAQSSPPSTHRGHLRRIGGVRHRIPGAVHDGLESLSTIDGIRTQALPAKRGLSAEELIGTSGPLTLVTNWVMAWNTQRLQRAVDREAEHTAPRYSTSAVLPGSASTAMPSGYSQHRFKRMS